MFQLTQEQMLQHLAGQMFQLFNQPQYQVPGKDLIHVYTLDDLGFRLAYMDTNLQTGRNVTQAVLADQRFVEVQLDGVEVLVGMSVFDAQGAYESEGPGTRYVQDDDETADHYIEEIVKDIFQYLVAGEIPKDVKLH